jgi:hypothetical protein
MKMRSFREFVTGISSKAPWNAFGTKKNRVIVLKTAEPAPLQKGETRNWSGIIEGLFFVFGLLAFASLVLGYFAYTRPLWRTVSDDVSYQQTGVFSYSAVVPEGVYDSRKLITGEPVFSKLTCFLNLQFDYALAGDDLQEITAFPWEYLYNPQYD